jgi:polyribonucleotide nucleotidyltransferase
VLHVSEIGWTQTDKVEDVLKVGDEVDVKLLEYDAKSGKMRLSMRALTEKPEGYVEPKGGRGGNGGERSPRREGGERGERRERRDGDRGPRRDGDRREGGERRERREGDRPRRDDRPRHSNGPRPSAPAPTADDYREPVDELY